MSLKPPALMTSARDADYYNPVSDGSNTHADRIQASLRKRFDFMLPFHYPFTQILDGASSKGGP